MEKRALLAISLSIGVMVVWYAFFAPPPPSPPPSTPVEEAVPVGPGAPATPVTEGSPGGAGPEGASSAQEIPPDMTDLTRLEPEQRADAVEEFRLVTETHDVRFTNEGGRILWWRLPEYKKDEDIPVELIPRKAGTIDILPMQVLIEDDPEATERLAAALHEHTISDIRASDPSGLGPGKRVSFTWADGRGLRVEKTLSLPLHGYAGRLEVSVTRSGRPVPARVVLASGLGEAAEDTTRRMWHVEGRGVIDTGRGIERLDADDVTLEMAVGGPLRWAGLESTYFAALVLPEEDAQSTSTAVVYVARRAGVDEDPLLTAEVRTGAADLDQRIFVGPKDYALLESFGIGLEHVIDFSSISVIYVITKYLFLALTRINDMVGNYGWSIIILTFIVRVAFFPVTYRSMINMRRTSKKMAKVQPKVKSIQERYKKQKRTVESQRKMNEEIMAIYKREGVNPMASVTGCLPLLLQMPIFIAFYNLLAVTIEVRHAPFIGWIQDLSRQDPIYVTPILMGISWLLQQMMTSSSIPDPTQRRMMMLMPVIFTVMMLHMPSGLVLYWLTSNLLGMAQQYFINKKADAIVGKPATA